MHTIRVQPDPFDPGQEIAAILNGQTQTGGLGCFIGTVRDTAAGRPIRAMTLEHYPAMTTRALATIRDHALARWPLQATTIIHRIGRLVPADPIVIVLATSAHRHAALEATTFLIDWLKTSAPFWKQEEFADGQTAWVAATAADTEAAARWHAT